MYDPTIGRWTSTDPLGFEAEDPNLYRYVDNNPVNGTDPAGLFGYYPPKLGGPGPGNFITRQREGFEVVSEVNTGWLGWKWGSPAKYASGNYDRGDNYVWIKNRIYNDNSDEFVCNTPLGQNSLQAGEAKMYLKVPKPGTYKVVIGYQISAGYKGPGPAGRANLKVFDVGKNDLVPNPNDMYVSSKQRSFATGTKYIDIKISTSKANESVLLLNYVPVLAIPNSTTAEINVSARFYVLYINPVK